MLALLEESEKTLHEAITEGNEEEGQQLQGQINEIRAIFNDITFLIQESGMDIDDISPNVARSADATAWARARLLRDVKPQRSNCFQVCVCRIFGMCFSLGS